MAMALALALALALAMVMGDGGRDEGDSKSNVVPTHRTAAC